MIKPQFRRIQLNILRPVRSETFHTNPKRRRGNELKPSLTLRVSIPNGREQYQYKRNRGRHDVSEKDRKQSQERQT
jgi:hypothetical protein